jgi:hypothetical protein
MVATCTPAAVSCGMTDTTTRRGGRPFDVNSFVTRDETLVGDGTTADPLGVGLAPSQIPFVPPYPDVVPTITTIYARTTGSDTTGDGSLIRPFRTAKRAFREYPNVGSPGLAYVVDLTDLGIEDFPAGYCLPPFQAPVQSYLFLDSSTLPFVALAALNIRATPRAFSSIPLADTTIPAANIASIASTTPGLTLVTVTAPRASWAADGAKGAMVIGDAGDAQLNCVVYASSSTTLSLANASSHVDSQELFLVEPSVEFHAVGPGSDAAGFVAAAAGSIALQGIKFTIEGGGSADQVALSVANTLQPFMELCDVDGVEILGVQLQFLALASVFRDFVASQSSAWSPRRSLVTDAGFLIIGGPSTVLRQVALTGCDPLGPGGFTTDVGANPLSGWELLNVLIKDGIGDGFAAAEAGAYSLQDVEIDDCAGDALSATGLVTLAISGVTGSGSTGVGIHLRDGATCRVLDDATLVSGGGGDVKVGIQPVRTWSNFRTAIPTKNQYDLQTPFVTNAASGKTTPGGDDVGGSGSGGCSGSRLFQRP